MTSGTSTNIYDVSYGRSTFVAVGGQEILVQESSSPPLMELRGLQVTSDSVNDVSYGGSTFVAVGGQRLVVGTSSDGTSWTSMNLQILFTESSTQIAPL